MLNTFEIGFMFFFYFTGAKAFQDCHDRLVKCEIVNTFENILLSLKEKEIYKNDKILVERLDLSRTFTGSVKRQGNFGIYLSN